MKFEVAKDRLLLDTERLVLRPLTVSDVTDHYVAWLADPDVNRHLETRHAPQPRGAVEQFVAAQFDAPDAVLFGMFEKSGGRHIGNIKIGPVKKNHSVADISLFIGAKDSWGKGYATEAIRAVSRFGFESLGLAKLAAVAYAVNAGSVRAFLKAGFQQEGLRRGHYILDGRSADVVEVGMIPDDLKSTDGS